jgi:hypothetical protein
LNILNPQVRGRHSTSRSSSHLKYGDGVGRKAANGAGLGEEEKKMIVLLATNEGDDNE